ncbi:glycosyltransferase [Aureliella helgolandensis]|uniref:Mannosylfructose-phosphate synthase n=1 Tax=Aureliella helgolandensis TaxID=2527968 RepID=A0A518GE31_9BACT|nr:glycosyltransferase [Aureliella helgolandensis]QDV26817.1 Mannosylfructose-phosphate synthase [Aureliella helgolandensis]
MNHPTEVSMPTPPPIKRPVRFLHIFPEYGRGGAELRVTRTINSMGPGAGHMVMSISGRMEAATTLDRACQVEVVSGPPKRGPIRFPIDLWKAVRKINPKVVLTYNWGATDAVLAAKIARFRPVLHNECGLSADVDGKGWRRRWIRRLLLPGCHRVIVTSHTIRDLALQYYGVSEKQLTFIKTGVDVHRFSPGRSPLVRQKITQGDESLVVFGYIGTLRPSKNLPMLLRAFAAANQPNTRLAIFGDGPERENLKALAQDLGISSAVYFHGYVDEPEHAFRAIDVNVTTSRSEAASNSLLEAMATGLPVITTDIADNQRMLGIDNRAFVYAHEDLAGYTTGLQRMATEFELRIALGKKNRAHVCTEYPIERMYREYAELWNSAAELARH